MSDRLEEILGPKGAEAELAKWAAGDAKGKSSLKDQQHPQAHKDRQLCERISQEGQTDYNLAELARLRIRYNGFPGARDLQAQLDQILKDWGLTEAQLFEKTRQIHANGQIYRVTSNKREDWS
uniref:DUF3288 domain-containing protein n=1 Tax=Cyanothece sp. (strain PCC 7425 / ATCC 29141) TaxID=395961 RepID=B8HJP1_CYAP4